MATAPPDQGSGTSAGPADAPPPPPQAARNRLNLIELITADAVASDYSGVAARREPSPRREAVLVAAIALGLVGFVLALGLSARIINAPAVDSQKLALRARIAQAQATQSGLTAEVASLRRAVEEARQAELDLVAGGAAVAAEVAALELATGYVAVTGPGVLVTLSDARGGDEGGPSDVERVLDTDVQRAVNGLWAAGAEAISVNDQRLSARSAIRSAAGAILVNYHPLLPPIQIRAIGPDSLQPDFEAGADAAYLDGVATQYGIGFTTEPADDLRLPAATSPLPEQATVIEAGEGE